jgi:hypothetical protein
VVVVEGSCGSTSYLSAWYTTTLTRTVLISLSGLPFYKGLDDGKWMRDTGSGSVRRRKREAMGTDVVRIHCIDLWNFQRIKINKEYCGSE